MDAIGPIGSEQDPCCAKVLNGHPCRMRIEIACLGKIDIDIFIVFDFLPCI